MTLSAHRYPIPTRATRETSSSRVGRRNCRNRSQRPRSRASAAMISHGGCSTRIRGSTAKELRGRRSAMPGFFRGGSVVVQLGTHVVQLRAAAHDRDSTLYHQLQEVRACSPETTWRGHHERGPSVAWVRKQVGFYRHVTRNVQSSDWGARLDRLLTPRRLCRCA